jgi:hypothetical protein
MLRCYGDRMIAGGHATGGGRTREDGRRQGCKADSDVERGIPLPDRQDLDLGIVWEMRNQRQGE